MASIFGSESGDTKLMDAELFKKYKKLGRQKIKGKGFSLWKGMYSAMLAQTKDQPLVPFMEMMLNVFLDVGSARVEGKPIIMHTFNYGPEIFYAMGIQPLMQELFSVGLSPVRMNPTGSFYIKSG